MYLECSTAKTANQQRIFENALISLMQDEDFEKISVVEICQRAGITRRIFYRLFETKHDCLVAAIDHKMSESEIYQSKEGRNGFSQLLEYIVTEKDFFVTLSKSNLMGLFMERLFNYMDNNDLHIKKIIDAFETFEREVVIYNVIGFIGIVFHWIETNFERSIDEMSDILMSIWCKQFGHIAIPTV